MKKIISYFILVTLTFILVLTVILSSIGIETNKFNKFISDKASESKNIKLNLDTIKFKIDLQSLSLFLETQNPEIIYRETSVPAKNIKVYIDFLSLLKSEPKIKKISVALKELDIKQLNKLSIIIKPSNFKSLLNNRIKKGVLISEIDIFLKNDGSIDNFITRGSVKNLKIELIDNLNFSEVNLGFFADKNDVLIKNINGKLKDIKIFDGDIKLNLENGLDLNSNFNSRINLDQRFLGKYAKIFKKNSLISNLKQLDGEFDNNLFISLDNTYKIKNYKYTISGKLQKGKFEFSETLKNKFIKNIKEIYFTDSLIKSIIKPNSISFDGEGKYSLNNKDFLKFNLKNNFNDIVNKLKLEFDYKDSLELDLINYRKPKNSNANLSLYLEKKKNEIKIDNFNFKEGSNLINLNGLVFRKKKFVTFKKIEIFTNNNNFTIKNDNIITIKGNKFDATNLAKFFNTKNTGNTLQNLNRKVEIDFKNIKVPMSEKLRDFKLIGEIKKGQFIKINSKGDFGGNNFLDISMKKDELSNRKYLEVYSDLTRPLLTEYSFFDGLSGGKLLFTSIIDNTKSNSKLKIENFKVINAPGLIKLLSLADLGGLVDLAEGDGLSFDVLEINLDKDKNFLKINEILALGPSISVLMEGYQDDNGLTSLRGTLVPAKTLNKMISKIPVIGKIIIPKEVGEGLFGISFKMKGSKGNIKTTINPIRTLTPRFIQKIIEKNNEIK